MIAENLLPEKRITAASCWRHRSGALRGPRPAPVTQCCEFVTAHFPEQREKERKRVEDARRRRTWNLVRSCIHLPGFQQLALEDYMHRECETRSVRRPIHPFRSGSVHTTIGDMHRGGSCNKIFSPRLTRTVRVRNAKCSLNFRRSQEPCDDKSARNHRPRRWAARAWRRDDADSDAFIESGKKKRFRSSPDCNRPNSWTLFARDVLLLRYAERTRSIPVDASSDSQLPMCDPCAFPPFDEQKLLFHDANSTSSLWMPFEFHGFTQPLLLRWTTDPTLNLDTSFISLTTIHRSQSSESNKIRALGSQFSDFHNPLKSISAPVQRERMGWG